MSFMSIQLASPQFQISWFISRYVVYMYSFCALGALCVRVLCAVSCVCIIYIYLYWAYILLSHLIVRIGRRRVSSMSSFYRHTVVGWFKYLELLHNRESFFLLSFCRRRHFLFVAKSERSITLLAPCVGIIVTAAQPRHMLNINLVLPIWRFCVRI